MSSTRQTWEFQEHNPDEIYLYRIPFNYDPSVRAPLLEAFFEEVTGGGDNTLLFQEHAGHSLYPKLLYHKALFLSGGGRNGKNALVEFYEILLGTLCSHLNLTELKVRFAKFSLYMKFLNICSEPDPNKLFPTEAFKSVVAGDEQDAEIKNVQERYKYRPFARWWILGNRFPYVDDVTQSFWDRLDFIEFPNYYGTTPIPNVTEKLIVDCGGLDRTMQALINWSLYGLKRLINQGGFTENDASKKKKIEYRKLSDPVGAFFDERCVIKPSEVISIEELWGEYKSYCAVYNLEIVPDNDFNKRLKRLPGVYKRKKRYGENKASVWCWMGIRTKKEEDLKKTKPDEDEDDAGTGNSTIDHFTGNRITTKLEREKRKILDEFYEKHTVCSRSSRSSECVLPLPTGKNKSNKKEEKSNRKERVYISIKHPEHSEHSEQKTEEFKYKCICGASFPSSGELAEHLNTCEEFHKEQSKDALKRLMGDAS